MITHDHGAPAPPDDNVKCLKCGWVHAAGECPPQGAEYGERDDLTPEIVEVARTPEVEPLTETEWKAILDAMLLTEEQCPVVSDAHFSAKEKVRAAIPYPTARGIFDSASADAPEGRKTWRDQFYEDMHREWAVANGWTSPTADAPEAKQFPCGGDLDEIIEQTETADVNRAPSLEAPIALVRLAKAARWLLVHADDAGIADEARESLRRELMVADRARAPEVEPQPVTRAELEEAIEARVSIAVTSSGGWPTPGLETANKLTALLDRLYTSRSEEPRIESARRLCDAYHFAFIKREADSPETRAALGRMGAPPGAGEQWFWQRVVEELDTYKWSPSS